MRNRDLIVGVGAGFSAIAALLICAFPLNMTGLASLLVGALVGGAALLVAPGGPLGPRTKPNEVEARAIAAARHKLESLERAIGILPSRKKEAAGNLRRIADEAGQILAVIESDPNKFAAAEPFLNQVLTPIESLASQYAKLASRDVETAEDFLVQTEQALPGVIRQLDKWYEQLHINDIAKLMSGTIQLESTLPTVVLKSEEEKL